MPLTDASFHILAALANADQHGYAILRDVQEATGGHVRLNVGTLYTNLKRLLDQGLIDELDERPSAEDDERRRYYHLNEEGRRALAEEAARLARMVDLVRRAGIQEA